MPISIREKKKKPEAPVMPSEVKKKRNASRERTQRPPQSAYKAMGYSGGAKIKIDPQYKSAGGTIFTGR